MTFEEAADAYEMIQSGLSIRKTARVIGMSHTRLGQVIKSCLEHGRSSPLLNAKPTGRPRQIAVAVLKHGMVMRDNGIPLAGAATALKVNYEALRRALLAFDPNPITADNPYSQANRERVNQLRRQAEAQGNTKFTTHVPCSQGHYTRYVSNGKCAQCQIDAAAQRRKRNPASDIINPKKQQVTTWN